MVLKLNVVQMMTGPIPDDAFAAWYVDDILKPELPSFYTDLGPQLCRTFTTNGRRYAEHFGLRRPDLQAQFITLMWQLAPSFFETPGFRAILDNPALNEAAKIDALYAVPDEVAAEAIRDRNEEYWYPELIPGNVLGIEVEDFSDLFAELDAKKAPR